MLTPELEKRVRHILYGLQSGKIELNHAVRLLGAETESHTVEAVMGIVPPELYDATKKLAEAMPRTDAEWAKWQDLSLRCAEYDPKANLDLIEQQCRDSERQTRRAIGVLRDYFAAHEG